MRINSSGNVGIGTSSPERTLDVSGDMRISDTGVNTGLRITVDTNREAYLVFGDTSDATMAGIAYDNSTNALTVDANNAERMRIDSSGNFMVGKTSANTNTAGFEIIPAGRIGVTRSGNITAMFNRLSSDGEIVRFQKDGTTVGTIGTAGGSIYIGNSSSKGVFFTNGATVPGTSGSGTDNTFDLGTSSSRWKDLYLGGGAFIGGTDTAHILDDYEEGDWTPSYTAASGTPVYNVRAGSYTKVGRKVTVTGAISAARGSLSGDVTISGLPFSCSSATKFSNSVSLMGEDWNSTLVLKAEFKIIIT